MRTYALVLFGWKNRKDSMVRKTSGRWSTDPMGGGVEFPVVSWVGGPSLNGSITCL